MPFSLPPTRANAAPLPLSLAGRPSGGHPTRAASPSSHERVVEMPAQPQSPGLSETERQALVGAIRTAPPLPSTLMKDPAVAALADEARRRLARGTGRRPEEIEVDVRALPGSDNRVLFFREASGRGIALPGGALSAQEAHGMGAALAELNVIGGLGLGYRVVPGVFSAAAMTTVGRFSDREALATHLRAGATTTVASAAYVWEVKDRPSPVGPALAVSAPFVSSGQDPLLGDKLELSIPGYVSVIAAVKHGDGSERDVGWLGVVWHQGLLGPGPGPTVNAKLVVGHPVLAAPLAPVVGAATAVLSPIMARLHALGQGKAKDASPQPSAPDGAAAERL